MNVFVIGSPWHAIVASAFIEENRVDDPVFIVEVLSQQSLEQIEKVLVYPVLSVFYHSETRFESIRKKGLLKFIIDMRRELSRIRIECNKLTMGGGNVGLYYFNFYSPITRKIFKSLAVKRCLRQVIRIEDGICDYFDFNFATHKKYQLALKGIISSIIGSKELYARENSELFSATTEYYCFQPDKITNKWADKKRHSLSFCAARIKSFYSSDKEAYYGHGGSLIIGQTLYEDGIISLKQEVDLYSEVAKLLHEPVIFKPHPRTSREKLEVLSEIGMNVLITDLSAEHLMVNGGYEAIVGMWSNTIIYSDFLFGIKSYTLNYHLLEKIESDLRDSKLIKIHDVLSGKFSQQYRDYRQMGKK